MTEENKKRLNDELIENKPLKKRKELDPELSEEGPLTQSDVLYFQKEAIFRQMKVYRKQSKVLNQSLNLFKSKYRINERKVNVLDTWYQQIIELLTSKGFISKDQINHNLLVKIPDEDIDDILTKRREGLLELLMPLLNNDKISSPEKQELLNRLEELTNELLTMKSENESLNSENSILNESVTNLNTEILFLTQEIERVNSKSLKRVSETFKNKEESNGDSKDEVKHAEANGNSKVKAESNEPEPEKVNNEEFENLTIELNEIRALNETLKKQLEDQVRQNNGLRDQTQDLAYSLSNLGDREIMTTPQYEKLNKSYLEVSSEIKDLKESNKTILEKVETYESERNSYKTTIEEQFNSEKELLTQQLSKSETDLIRIRTTRDDLLGKISILKSQVPNKELIEELNKLIGIQKERIENLENKENGTGTIIEEDDSKLLELSSEQLIKKVQILTKELKELEAAFKSTHSVSIKKLSTLSDTESKINKLSVEKTKADQKYFAAMRAKDALSLENKTIKLQINKSNEIISQFKDIEKTYNAKFDNSNLIQQDLKFQIINKEEELKQLRPANQLLIRESNSKEEEIRELKSIKDELREEIKSNEIKIRDYEASMNKIQTKLKSVESLLHKYQKNDKSSIMKVDEEQINALRSMVKCSVCSKNWKNTVIKNCGHVFCNDCAQERLAARLRRCPSCNKQFSSNDLLMIHL